MEGTKVYDLLYIIANKYAENELPPILKRISDLAVKHEAKIIKEVNYGKRRLAYAIKHNHYGYYILDRLEMTPKACDQLNKDLRVQDEVLRHLITVTLKEGDVPKEADLKQVEVMPSVEQPLMPKKRTSLVDVEASDQEREKMKKGSRFDLDKELGVTAAEAEESLKKEEAKKQDHTTVNPEELEKKLDEIMKTME